MSRCHLLSRCHCLLRRRWRFFQDAIDCQLLTRHHCFVHAQFLMFCSIAIAHAQFLVFCFDDFSHAIFCCSCSISQIQEARALRTNEPSEASSSWPYWPCCATKERTAAYGFPDEVILSINLVWVTSLSPSPYIHLVFCKMSQV